MSTFLPLTIRFADGATMLVASIADAKKALGGIWKNKDARDYLAAVRLVDDAMEGTCRPAVAFAAFKKAAAGQGLLEPHKPSAALKMLDQLSRDGKAPLR